MKKKAVLLLASILFCGSLLYGQQPGRTSEGLAGRVTDAEKNSLPGMTVFVRSAGFVKETITDVEGNYYLELPPGKYEVRAGTNCDQTSYHKDVEIERGKTTNLDLTVPLYKSYAANVSIYQLLSSPERFQGRFITVSGYYRFGQELSALFASKDDADYFIGKNSLWINLTGSEDLRPDLSKKSALRNQSIRDLDGRYITIEGIFDKNACGHMSMSAGQIKKVTRVIELTRYYDGKKKLR